MGLMYWQLGDIWQAPTSSTVEYELKWKMGHYYVQHMYEPVYPLLILTPYLANVTDENAQISIYVINELFHKISGSLNCSFFSLDSFSVRSQLIFDIFFDSAAFRHVADLSYASLIRRAECSDTIRCLFHCRLNTSRGDIGQTLFLTQPKKLSTLSTKSSCSKY